MRAADAHRHTQSVRYDNRQCVQVQSEGENCVHMEEKHTVSRMDLTQILN